MAEVGAIAHVGAATPVPPTSATPAPATPPPAPAATAASLAGDTVQTATPASRPIHLVFFSDAHDNVPLMNQMIDRVNALHPDLVIDGGDRSQNGTETELQRDADTLARLQAPLFRVEGNHDAESSGPSTTPSLHAPDFASHDQNGLHVILLDNHDETISDEQFRQLEADLAANQGKPTVVAMHVPVMLARRSTFAAVGRTLHLPTTSPVMTQADQVERFHALMRRYHVAAVLTGHTHQADLVERDGVHYVTVGATGGLMPGMSVNHEFLDLQLNGNDVQLRHIPLDEPAGNPPTYLGRTFQFIAESNDRNHQAGVWDYNPRNSAMLRSSLRYSQTAHGNSAAIGMTAALESDRMLGGRGGTFIEATIAGGQGEISAETVAGLKVRAIGDYNQNLYLSGGVGLNGGLIANQASAGVGARLAVGGEYKRLNLELGHEVATNRGMTFATVGYRF